MSIRSPSPSLFRPKERHRSAIARTEQGARQARSTAAACCAARSASVRMAMLTGCSSATPGRCRRLLNAVSSFNDKVQELMFRPNHLAPTFREDQVVKPPRFNAYYDIEDVKPVDGASWKLELAGLIETRRRGPPTRSTDCRSRN